MSADTISRLALLIAAFAEWPGARRVVFTGGEPFLFRKQMRPLAATARELGLRVGVETNGYWATSRAAAETLLATFAIDDFLISTSLFHRRFIKPERPLLAYQVAVASGRGAIVRVCVDGVNAGAEADMLRDIRSSVAETALVVEPVLPIGRSATDRAPDAGRQDDPLLCPADGMIVLDDGRIDPCCNSLNALTDHGLVMGSADDAPHDVLQRMDQDAVFAWIRERGLRAFVSHLATLGHCRADYDLPADPCVACARIFGDPQLREGIRAVRATPPAARGAPSTAAAPLAPRH